MRWRQRIRHTPGCRGPWSPSGEAHSHPDLPASAALPAARTPPPESPLAPRGSLNLAFRRPQGHRAGQGAPAHLHRFPAGPPLRPLRPSSPSPSQNHTRTEKNICSAPAAAPPHSSSSSRPYKAGATPRSGVHSPLIAPPMALAVRTPLFQPLPASVSATSTTSSVAGVGSARPCARAVRASAASSPFTEATSSSRYRRDAWSYAADGNSSSSDSAAAAAAAAAFGRRDDEIALQLPELRRLLDALRASRGKGADGEGGSRGPGRVALVGTGPGDPELLTLKAVRAIQSADLVLYDRLVSNDVMELVGEGARLLYVGKTAGYHSRTQEEIHELLLSFAEAGANVVRLKGGDPLVFGRGGEEMDFLQQQGIRVEVIPGITSASGIAAELGIPLTHRGVATSVRFLTGHSRNGGTDPLHVAGNAADPDTTLVVYMGLSTLPSLAPKLMKHGLPPDTPAVAVERGTTPQQRTVFAVLKDLVDEVKSADLVSPTLIIIGKVVALSPLWAESSEHEVSIEKSFAADAR